MPKIVQQPIVIGKFIGVYGIKGWLKVFSDTAPITNILEYTPWLLNIAGDWHEIKILQGKPHGKGLVVQLKGYDTPEASRALVGIEIAVERALLPALPPGEYYWTDLKGLQVINVEGQNLGQISQVFETGSNDVLIVTGTKRHLIPYLPNQTIISIDLAKKIIVVDWDADF